MQKAAPTRKRLPTKKSYENYSKIHHNYQYPEKPKKHYPHSDRSINLAKHCPYCDHGIGLIIIRFKDDLGFCKCGGCDAALYSLNESKLEQRSQHIGSILDCYLPCAEVQK